MADEHLAEPDEEQRKARSRQPAALWLFSSENLLRVSGWTLATPSPGWSGPTRSHPTPKGHCIAEPDDSTPAWFRERRSFTSKDRATQIDIS